MSYLAWYFGLGAVVLVLAAIYISHRLSKHRGPDLLSDIFAGADADREKLWNRVLLTVVAPVVAAVVVAVVVVVAWPVVLFIAVKQKFSEWTASTARAKREFAVAVGDLQEELTVQEVERRERVIDPLGAVPDLPFGHLHSAWQNFLGAVEPQDAIWTFSARRTTTWGCPDLRAGYVVVRDGAIGPHFLTLWRLLDEDSDDRSAQAGARPADQ